MANRKKICDISFNREDGKQVLSLSVVPEIEKLFADGDTQESTKYKDTDGDELEFYALKDKLAQFSDKYNAVYTRGKAVALREYGTKLMTNGKANLSILRTVDLEDGIEVVVDDLILDTEVSAWIESLAHFLKFLYLNFVEKAAISASIQLEY
jgi:hypothetical protein